MFNRITLAIELRLESWGDGVERGRGCMVITQGRGDGGWDQGR